jgi:Bacterial Ig domain
MVRIIAGACLLLLATGLAPSAHAARNCWVPRFRTLGNQTVDAQMTVRSGKPCRIVMLTSRGPIYGAQITAHPSHGSVTIDGRRRIVYQSRSGFVGRDSFNYARSGFDTRNNAIARTVRVDVEVTP